MMCWFLSRKFLKHRNLEVREALVRITQSSLGGDATEGKHGKTAVAQLLELHGVDLVLGLVLQEAKRVEGEVTSLAVRIALGNFNKNSAGAKFNEANGQKKEAHGSLLDEDVVGIVGVGNVLEDSKRESDAEISGPPSSNSKHSNSAVLQFSLTHPVKCGKGGSLLFPGRRLDESREILWDGGEVEGVKTNITDHGSIQVDGTRKERNCLGTFGLVDHGVPFAIRHTSHQGSVGALAHGGGGKSQSRTCHAYKGADSLHGR